MYSNPGIQGVLRTRILALFHRRIEVTRNLVPSVADASVRKQNENLTEVNIWPPCMHIMFGKVFTIMSVIIFMFQSWRKLHDHNDSNMLPWKEEHWCKFVCSIICRPIHVLPLIYPCCYLRIELDTNPTGWSSKVPATSDVSAYFCSFSGCDSLLKEKIVE